MSAKPAGLVATRYALKLTPPAVVLEYAEKGNLGKSRLRTVKLLELSEDSDVERLATKVLRSFPRNLDQSTVNVAQIRRLVQKLKDKKLGAAPASPVKRVAAEAEEAEAEVEELDLQAEEPVDLNDPNLDLNKVSITALKAAKKKMDTEFLKHQKLPGEQGFAYDVQVDFQLSEGVGDWDDESDSEGP